MWDYTITTTIAGAAASAVARTIASTRAMTIIRKVSVIIISSLTLHAVLWYKQDAHVVTTLYHHAHRLLPRKSGNVPQRLWLLNKQYPSTHPQ